MTSDRRYPFDSLYRIIHQHAADQGAANPKGVDRQIAEQLGVTRRTLLRLRGTHLDWQHADTLAVRCGMLPGDVWGSWYDDALTPLDDIYVNRGGWRHAWLWKEAS